MVSGEDRGVAPVIGFILVFSFLIIAFSIYQGVVIPDQNRKAEFQHSERVQGELLDLQDAIRRTGTTGVGQSVPIRVGADYPDRTLGVNFAVSGGRVSTVRPNASGPNNITFENVEAARSEVRDYWNSSAPDSTLAFPTKDIVFRPSYTRYTNAPDTVLSNTGVFNQFENANISLANQIMIQDDRITIVAINGSLDKGKSGEGASVSVDTQPLSVATNSITIRNNSEGPMNLTVPTTVANESVWNDSGLLDQSQLRSGGVSASGSELTIPLKNDTYTLRMAKVGVGSDTEDEGAEYIVPVESPPRTVFNDTSHQVTVEVRDRFNNPNSSTEVDASVVGTGGGSIAPTDGNGETDSQGEVTFNYTAPGGSGEDTLVFNISGDPAGTADERKIVNHSVTVVKSTSGGGTSGGDDGTGYDTEWYSPADLGPGTNANGELSSCSETDCTYDVGLDPTDDNVTLRAVIDLSAVGGLGVDFGVNDSSVAEPFPSENDTDSNSNATTVLNTTSDGTVAVYAVSGGSYDRINLSVISTPVVTDVTIGDDTDGNGIVTDGDTVEITATVTDATAITSVQADASAFDAGTVTLADAGPNSTAADDEYSAVVTVGAGVTDGARSVTVSATDEAGNGGAQNVASGTLTVDTTAPSIADPTPADGASGVDNATRYTVNVTDATSGVDESSITVTVEDSSGVILNSVGTGNADVTFFGANETLEIEAPAADYADGQVNVTVDAADNAGNAAPQFTSNFTVGATQAGQIQLSGAATAAGGSGKYEFDVTNTGSLDAEIVAVAINDTSNPNVVEVNNNKDILVANSTEIIDQPIPIDSSTPDGTRVNVKPGETPFVISKNGATATLEFNRFQDSGGQNVAMGGETVNTTFFFSDGSKATVTIN